MHSGPLNNNPNLPQSTRSSTADNQNNKSLKAPFMENTVLGVGSCVKYSTRQSQVLHLPLDPTPHTVFPYITCNSALTYMYILVRISFGSQEACDLQNLNQ